MVIDASLRSKTRSKSKAVFQGGQWGTCYGSGKNEAGGLPAKTLQSGRSRSRTVNDINGLLLQNPTPNSMGVQRFCPLEGAACASTSSPFLALQFAPGERRFAPSTL